MNQREFINIYNSNNRPKFNEKLFERSDVTESLKKMILSCQRDSIFTIKVLDFQVIENYDDINHLLWQYEDNILSKSQNAGMVNQYDYINLKNSDIKLLKVTYFIQINEKKNGLVNDTVVVYIAIPRIVDKYYYRIGGKLYSPLYQVTDASTYNNTSSKNAKKQSITFISVFMRTRVYRYINTLKDVDDNEIQCIYFLSHMFKKSVLLIKYLLGKFGLFGTCEFLGVRDLFIVNNYDNIDKESNYVFPTKNESYIVIPKFIYDNNNVAQSLVYTIYTVINYMKSENWNAVFSLEFWVKALGAEFTFKDIDSIYTKGISILNSLEFIYDDATKEDLKLNMYDKENMYTIIRWLMYEFTSLRQKDNLDVTTKKVDDTDYICALYGTKLAAGIYRISDKGDKADLNTIKKAIQIAPMFLINAITSCQLVTYKDVVNDNDALTSLKYTFKGLSGIGEKANAIPTSYRFIHPSHLGLLDIDSSSNSDPGITGTLCPLSNYDGHHFMDYEEPSTWNNTLNNILQQYNTITARHEICSIIDDNNLSSKDNSYTKAIQTECLSVAKSLSIPVLNFYNKLEQQNYYDVFGDGIVVIED